MTHTEAPYPLSCVGGAFSAPLQPGGSVVLIVQRVVPNYRRELFEQLKRYPGVHFKLASGRTHRSEAIIESTTPGLIDIELRNVRLPYYVGAPTFQIGLLKAVRAVSPDVIVVEANPRLISGLILAALSRRFGFSLVLWGLGQVDRPRATAAQKTSRLLYRYLVKRSSAAVGYSPKAAHFFHNLGMDASRITIAPNTTRPSPSDASVEQGMLVKHERAKSRGLPIVLYVGRLTAVKRVDLLVEASSHVTEPHEVIIVGDGPERSRLSAMAADARWPVHLVGQLEGPELDRWFQAATVFVLPGRGGLAIQEALAFAVPVIVGRADGTEDVLVEAGVTGLRFEEGDYRSLATMIDRALLDDDLSRQMGINGRRRVLEAGGLDQMIDAFAAASRIAITPR